MARLDYKLRKKVHIPEFQDELGIYKICRICGAKFYYKDYDIELAKKVPQYAKRMNILKQSWNRKTTCSHACQDVRTEQIKQEFRAFVQQAKNKKYTCITCGTEFPFSIANHLSGFI